LDTFRSKTPLHICEMNDAQKTYAACGIGGLCL
jgi:hypothetical protein